MRSFEPPRFKNLLTMLAMTLLVAPVLSAGKKARKVAAPPITGTHHKLRIKLLQNSLQGRAEAATELEMIDALDFVETSKGWKFYPRTLALGFARPDSAPRLGTSEFTRSNTGTSGLELKKGTASMVKPNAMIRNCDFRDMNIAKWGKGSWAGSMIVDSRLERANLAGMDLRGTTFTRCEFDGAVWDAAQLFKTQFFQCRNLDISKARLHPFFEPAAGEGLETFKVYELPHGEIRTSSIKCGSEGELYIGSPESAESWTLTCTGTILASDGRGEPSLWSDSPNKPMLQLLGKQLFDTELEIEATIASKGPQGTVLFGTFPQANSVGIQTDESTKTWDLTELLSKGEAQALRLRQAALGPDGHLWLTLGPPEQGGAMGAIGRLTAAGALTTWILPRGFVPQGIVAGKATAAGRIYFTLEGQSALGCMTLKGPEARVPESPAEGTDPEPEDDKEGKEEKQSGPRPITDHDRREAAFLRELGSRPEDDAVWDSPKPRPSLGERKDSKEVEVETKRPAPKSSSSSSTPPPRVAPPRSVSDSVAALAHLRVSLHDFRIDHIVGLHHYNSPVRDSQFNPEYSTREGLASVLAEAMAEAGDMIGRVHKPSGGFLTRVDLGKPVGYHWAFRTRTWEPTQWVEVHTNRIQVASGMIHNIRTAYPIENPFCRH